MIPPALALQALCRERFAAFCHKGFTLLEPGRPYEHTWHIDCIAEHIQAQFEGDAALQWLIINIPPRCLKSVQVAQLFPAWALGKEPHHQLICASYVHTLAERNVVNARRVITSDWFANTFPETKLSRDQNQKDYFVTTKQGSYKGTGIGGTITGFGCKTLIVDDPINPKESRSDAVRLNAITEIRSTLFSRYNDHRDPRFVLIMQRTHEADPTGDLLADGGYYHLKLPAENSSGKTITYSSRGLTWEYCDGDMLTPRLPRKTLDRLRVNMTDYEYVSQYLQDPVPLGGGEFKEEWLQHYRQGSIKPTEMNLCIVVDAAGGDEINRRKKKLSDWTVMAVVGKAPDRNIYLLDMIRDRLNPTERIDTLFMLHRKWLELTKKNVVVGYEKYGMMTDVHYAKEKMAQQSYHFRIVELGGAMAKEERIRKMIPDMQNGRWYIPDNLIYIDIEGRKFDLVAELKGELRSFPRARWDDISDALARTYDQELYLDFPAPRETMVGKEMRKAQDYYNYGGGQQSWEDL